METQPSAQFSFQKLNFGNSFQKTHKIREQIFEVLSNCTVFLYFVPNILARIVDKACFQHDMAYRDFKDLNRGTAADKTLRDKAFNIAKNPK